MQREMTAFQESTSILTLGPKGPQDTLPPGGQEKARPRHRPPGGTTRVVPCRLGLEAPGAWAPGAGGTSKGCWYLCSTCRHHQGLQGPPLDWQPNQDGPSH